MSRFVYEKSITYQEYLIIPFVFSNIDSHDIYSYCLLAEQGYKNQLHKAINPAGLYSSKLEDVIDIAKKHLDEQATSEQKSNYFQQRYTYNNNLIIIHQQAGKCFYDHYAPEELNNIAAPRIFNSSLDCISWVKRGLKHNKVNKKAN
jgi:hypothetical protein